MSLRPVSITEDSSLQKNKHKINLSYLTCGDCHPLDTIKIASKLGYDSLGFRLMPSGPNQGPFVLMDSEKTCREAVILLRDLGIKALDIEIIKIDKNFDVRDYKKLFEKASQLGAGHLVVIGQDKVFERLVNNFTILCESAGKFDLTIELEFMPWTSVPDLATANDIILRSKKQNSGILMDALHIDRSNISFSQIKNINPNFVNIFQFCDASRVYDASEKSMLFVSRNNRLFPGDGELDLLSLAHTMHDHITVSVEVPNHELAKKMSGFDRASLGIKRIKNILEQIS